jgi:hypothetical protein
MHAAILLQCSTSCSSKTNEYIADISKGLRAIIKHSASELLYLL